MSFDDISNLRYSCSTNVSPFCHLGAQLRFEGDMQTTGRLYFTALSAS
jgi:hypothetical protein